MPHLRRWSDTAEQELTGTPSPSRAPTQPRSSVASQLRTLQRLTGNRAVSRMVADGRLVVPRRPVVQRQVGLKEGTKVMVKCGPSTSHPAVITATALDGQSYTVRFDDDELNTKLDRTYQERSVTGPAAPFWKKEHLRLDPGVILQLNQIAGDVTRVNDLSEEQIELMIDVLAPPKPEPPSSSRPASRAAKPRLPERKPLNAAVGILVTETLQPNLKDLREKNETPEAATVREQSVNADLEALKDEAFKGRFGTKPEEAKVDALRSALELWFKGVKAAEGRIEFEAAFRANRMTARQINAAGRRGEFRARQYGSGPNPDTDRKMVLDNTLAGIGKRGIPENFKDQATINREGVHDLSASLLQGSPPGRGIFQQLKYYKDAVVVFMPLPEESDLRIFAALAKVQGMDAGLLAEWGGLLSRPVLAQASDMGTVYVDTTTGTEGEGTFRYGLTGTVIRKAGDRARKINNADLAERRRGALTYKTVASAGITKVNEVVMAYRQHASDLFPMFARWDDAKGQFSVVTAELQPTGKIITNMGQLK